MYCRLGPPAPRGIPRLPHHHQLGQLLCAAHCLHSQGQGQMIYPRSSLYFRSRSHSQKDVLPVHRSKGVVFMNRGVDGSPHKSTNLLLKNYHSLIDILLVVYSRTMWLVLDQDRPTIHPPGGVKQNYVVVLDQTRPTTHPPGGVKQNYVVVLDQNRPTTHPPGGVKQNYVGGVRPEQTHHSPSWWCKTELCGGIRP